MLKIMHLPLFDWYFWFGFPSITMRFKRFNDEDVVFRQLDESVILTTFKSWHPFNVSY